MKKFTAMVSVCALMAASISPVSCFATETTTAATSTAQRTAPTVPANRSTTSTAFLTTSALVYSTPYAILQSGQGEIGVAVGQQLYLDDVYISLSARIMNGNNFYNAPADEINYRFSIGSGLHSNLYTYDISDVDTSKEGVYYIAVKIRNGALSDVTLTESTSDVFPNATYEMRATGDNFKIPVRVYDPYMSTPLTTMYSTTFKNTTTLPTMTTVLPQTAASTTPFIPMTTMPPETVSSVTAAEGTVLYSLKLQVVQGSDYTDAPIVMHFNEYSPDGEFIRTICEWNTAEQNPINTPMFEPKTENYYVMESDTLPEGWRDGYNGNKDSISEKRSGRDIIDFGGSCYKLYVENKAPYEKWEYPKTDTFTFDFGMRDYESWVDLMNHRVNEISNVNGAVIELAALEKDGDSYKVVENYGTFTLEDPDLVEIERKVTFNDGKDEVYFGFNIVSIPETYSVDMGLYRQYLTDYEEELGFKVITFTGESVRQETAAYAPMFKEDDYPYISTMPMMTTTAEVATSIVSNKETQTTVADLSGDANCDGKVNIADATAIVQFVANPDKYGLTEQGRKNADCYNEGDGVSPLDALAIQKLEAKIISSLPYSD